jgi:histone deacetylase 1/2
MTATPSAPAPPPTSAPNWDQAAFLQAMNNFAAQGSSDFDWIFDSGASSHMSSSCNMLSSFTSSPFSSITLGDGSSIPISCVGQSHIPTKNKPLLLRDVLVAPALIKKFIFVRKFTRDNLVSAEFDPFGLSVKDFRTKEEIARFNSSGDLYSLHGAPTNAPPTSMVASVDLWHRRFGHPNNATLSSLLSEFAIPCNRDTHHPATCESCQQGKHVRLPFSSSSTTSMFPFELLHCDLWTSPIESISGFKYYLVMLDDFTHFVWTFPLRNKSDVHKFFLNFQHYVSAHFLLPIRFIQTDNGREFNNYANRNFFLQHGILFRFSCPYTSPQNGKAERVLRTINDIIRTMLIQSSLPSKFWAEALRTATYLLNIRPTKANPNTTPYYSLFLSHPNYIELRVFGCLCFPNAYATSINKLSPRSNPCVFLGYSDEHKGYILLSRSS